jgi:hypothetical protein
VSKIRELDYLCIFLSVAVALGLFVLHGSRISQDQLGTPGEMEFRIWAGSALVELIGVAMIILTIAAQGVALKAKHGKLFLPIITAGAVVIPRFYKADLPYVWYWWLLPISAGAILTALLIFPRLRPAN